MTGFNGNLYDNPLWCRHCTKELVGCEGKYGIWMHDHSRKEFCDDGNHIARPTFTSDKPRKIPKEKRAKNDPQKALAARARRKREKKASA